MAELKLKKNHPTELTATEICSVGFCEVPPLRLRVLSGPPTAELELAPLPLLQSQAEMSSGHDNVDVPVPVSWRMYYDAGSFTWESDPRPTLTAAAPEAPVPTTVEEEIFVPSCCGLFKTRKTVTRQVAPESTPLMPPAPAPAPEPARPLGEARVAVHTGRAGVTITCPSLSSAPYADGAAWLVISGALQQHELRLGDVLKLGSVLILVASLDSRSGSSGSSSSSSTTTTTTTTTTTSK